LITLTECADITFEDNQIMGAGPFMKTIVDMTSTASAVGMEKGFEIKTTAPHINK